MRNAPRFRVKPTVRAAVARMNVSQNHLASRCGVTSGFMSQLLSGQRNAGPTVRARLLEHLGLSFDDLFEEVR
ncbi:MAG: helix-turn-helix transcriptional regulator [Deltaproteobacteria bacterium]|nr:helix-turn-helix transcriptional regulator [Deltaproteobacteria bacterium]